VLALLLTGCPTTSPGDAGLDAGTDAPVPDGGSDAGPCAMECTGTTPLCDAMTGDCVECLSETDCTSPENACVDGVCVACDSDDDCPAAMPQCDTATNTCGACTGPAACMDRPEGEVCEGGACVECTMADRSGCASGVCLLSTNTCAPMGGSTALCGTCTADSECMAGQVCIAMMYDDPATAGADPVAVGNHCLWRSDASGTGAPNGACSTVRPYVSTQSVTSVSGVTADVCTFRVSTCEAQRDFSMVNCMTLDATGNALCGVTGVPDGVCRRLDAASNRCTTYCLSDDDCPSGSTCDTTTTPRQCRL
jgi:hypothetical protein